MFYFWKIIFWTLTLKAIWRCLYFWQLKEYRWDRFKEVVSSPQLITFSLPTRHFLRPKFTIKTIVITGVSLYLNLILTGKLHYILVYFFTPLVVTFMVLALKPFTWLGYQIIITLAQLKLKFFYPHLKVIGITGSYGKTSTKEILSYLLSSKYRVCKTPGTNNTAIGVAKAILKSLKTYHQVFVVEMGAYTKGEIKQIANLVKPQIGIITGITSQHLKLFGSMDNLLKAKLELIFSLPQDGLAVLNGTSPELITAAKKITQKKILYYQPKEKYKTNLLGDFQQLNIQAAMQVAKFLGVDLKMARKKIQTIPRFKTMIKIKTGLNKATFYLDNYNSNPVGFNQAIKLIDQDKSKHKVLISSGIFELGSASRKTHQQLGKLASKVFSEIIITREKPAKEFKLKAPQTVFMSDHHHIYQHLKSTLTSKSIVLIEGRLPEKFIKKIC